MPIPNAEIAEVNETFAGRTGEYDDQFGRRYTRIFRVVTQADAIGSILVQFAEGIPRVFDAYENHGATESDPLAICRRVTPIQDVNDPLLWMVTCEYSTRAPTPIGAVTAPPQPGRPGGGSGGPTDNPELRPPKVRIDWQEFNVPVQRQDFAAKVYANSAGDLFDPTPTIQVACPVLCVERYELWDDPEEALETLTGLAYNCNDGPFLWGNEDEWQLLPVGAEQELIGPTLYWRCAYRVRYANFWPYTWQHKILDAGLRKFSGIHLINPPIFDMTGQPVTTPRPLRNGQEMSTATLQAEGPDYLDFQPYPRTDFDALSLI